jgi:hypothetical protein
MLRIIKCPYDFKRYHHTSYKNMSNLTPKTKHVCIFFNQNILTVWEWLMSTQLLVYTVTALVYKVKHEVGNRTSKKQT